ncbi:MAG: FtsX-like permease family protein [Parcubacteria group bacterium]|jgi:putative ABC transport system permease protein|nr:FtsX-like permease family protein [Parcubacteria group bacterium]HRT18161.1 ABC transporter permease [Candidatus Paceibacterota bacterium]
MDILESIKNAWQTITRAKTRSFLTMLGIIIGISAVMIVLSVGESVQELILDEVRSVGSDLITILPGSLDEDGRPSLAFGAVKTSLKYEDGEAIMKSDHQNIHSLAMYLTGNDVISIDGKMKGITFYGTTASYPEVQDSKIEKGRFFTKEEEISNARVVVLGGNIAREIFGDNDPIGQKVAIKKLNFNVIGVLEKKGASLIQSQDNDLFIPISTAQNVILGVNHINFIRVRVNDINSIDFTIDYIKEILRERHNIEYLKEDDFIIASTTDALDTISLITDALKFFLTAVAAISLIVGGFGIMNIMLATVKERTKEIGLRRAIGAKKKEITIQFLIESVTITFISGIIGIILGILILILISIIIKSLDYNWTLIISPISILLGCLTSIGIGLIFGINPAKKAAELDPIEALRYE